jgi:transposase InsO family protein
MDQGDRGKRASAKVIGASMCCWGARVGAKRVRRLYREMGLQLRNKSPKRRVKTKLRGDRTTATGPNDVWAMDFDREHHREPIHIDIKKLGRIDGIGTASPVIAEARALMLNNGEKGERRIDM